MKLGVTVALLIAILTALGVFAMQKVAPTSDEQPTTPQISEGSSSTSTSLQREPITREPSSPDREVYINQEWRFSFEYPKGWELLPSAFGGPVTLSNIALNDPKRNLPIDVSVVYEYWQSEVTEELKLKGVEMKMDAFAGFDTLVFQGGGVMGRPSEIAIIQTGDEYWVRISGLNGYEKEREIVLNSFQFHDPPTLAELGLE